jgi:hypothetical protein
MLPLRPWAAIVAAASPIVRWHHFGFVHGGNFTFWFFGRSKQMERQSITTLG